MEPMLTKEIEELAKRRREQVNMIIAQAIKIGVSKLWRESILDQYLEGKVSRRKAIKSVGLDLVKLADKQREMVLEDVKWGLYA